MPLSGDELDRWLSGTVASGVETDEDDIGTVVCGRELRSATA